MNEAHFAEVEKALLFVSEARKRTDRAAAELGRDGAEQHLMQALREASDELSAVHRRLMQRTYFAVPEHSPGATPG